MDLITGAAEAPGVRVADAKRENLAFTRDVRRGILATLNERRGRWMDDFDILEHFEREGFVNIARAELQFQLWYLAGKGYVERHEITLLGQRNWRARITAAGIDLIEGAITDAGVTSDGR